MTDGSAVSGGRELDERVAREVFKATPTGEGRWEYWEDVGRVCHTDLLAPPLQQESNTQ